MSDIVPSSSSGLPLKLVVACVLVDRDMRVLLARRPSDKELGGLWEFPGGKLQSGESPEAALIRELREELGIETDSSCLSPLSFASHPYSDYWLLMPVFICRKWGGVPQAKEHDELKWVHPKKLRDYEMPPADLPLIPVIQDIL